MFDWNEYLILARELRSMQTEAALRSCISRAYYAAFCTALYRLHPNGYETFSRDSHASLWREYRERQGRALSHIGLKGDRIRKDRQSADYALEVPALEKVADRVLSEAALIVASLVGSHS